MKKAMMIILIIIVSFAAATYLFMQQKKFGKLPSGERLERIKASPNYRDGEFKNLSHTPSLAEGHSIWGVLKEAIFSDKSKRKPSDIIPSEKIDLHNLSPEENILVWFGHSSYFLQVDGKRILIDPVLSGAASPIPITTKAFEGTDVYAYSDIPEIDYLFITHDHWDHLDYETIMALKPKLKQIVCGLGVGSHFDRWGFKKEAIIEMDWNDKTTLDKGFVVHTTPTRHFSGRGFKRNQSLWVAFVFQSPSTQLFFGGDGGYDTHLLEIGKQFGSFDLALMENGQYNEAWKYIHMMPNEVLQAAKDLNAKAILPGHSGKFSLANHDWDTPLSEITKLHKDTTFHIITPLIGEKVPISNSDKTYTFWWNGEKNEDEPKVELVNNKN
ncbi:MBL fold metallo-hydrolase [Saccharicrinis aurantiacus]|uniref:MBL fold metallo-hydrolase n=1 Tax=Saccharicrinis aurantiacus TaxID=1849719 RepID=UPI00094F9E0C|nr:MBL fold metallo-hydrolase [Saccharicrinis aurantiacus]